MFSTFLKTDALAVGDDVPGDLFRAAHAAPSEQRRDSAVPGDRIIRTTDSVTNSRRAPRALVPATLYSRLLAGRRATAA
jgi:hypothetical protein